MKKIFAICLLSFSTFSAFSQAPEKMSYQAVIRNANNALLTSQNVGIRISILQGSVSGTAVYVERQTPSTNANGLVSIEIGNGTVISGTFSTIDWSNGPYFIKTETDPTGGTAYTITGTSQLLSTPYALYAKTSGSSTPGPQGTQGIQGIAGTDGTNGTNGQNSLSKTTAEPAGTNCATGGIMVEYGLDADGDGILDASEVNASLTKYVCNGAQGIQGIQGTAGTTGATGTAGTNGKNSLSKTTAESAGANCATGGVKVEYGLDANSNNVLDASEVTATLTRYVCNGAQGIQGTAGATGTTGTAGTNGKNSLSKTTAESAGANCATGGVKVEYGLDANSNGVLDASEVTATLTRYVCNGAQGVQGAAGTTGTAGTNGTNGQNSLSKTTAESAGANCATGGVKVEYGLDANSNSVLDAGEVNASLTRYVCNGAQGIQGAAGTNGADGKNTIVKTTTESAGSNCPGGGVKLEYGLDANSNGTLEAGEVNASLTKYVCNGDPGQSPVYLKTVMGAPFTINIGYGATAMVRFHTQCTGTAIGGLIFIQSNGDITVMSSGGSNSGSLTASGNVLSLNNSCIAPWTFTFTVSGGVATVTQGGGGGFHQEGKWQILGN